MKITMVTSNAGKAAEVAAFFGGLLEVALDVALLNEHLLALMRGYEGGGLFIYKDDMQKVNDYFADPVVAAAIPPGYEFIWGAKDVADASGRAARILYYCTSRGERDGKNLTGATP